MDFIAGEVLYFNKPLTWTSFDLVNKFRYKLSRKLKVKKIKVGHAGTLDPLATGVMIVCTGRATKRIDEFQYQTKEYVATLKLGETTPSFDLEKEIDAVYPTEHITRERVEEVLNSFVGTIQQIPPVFSACKVDGKRAYELARKGEEVELKSKTLVIDEMELLECDLPVIKIRVVCSKGFCRCQLFPDIAGQIFPGSHPSLVRCLFPVTCRIWVDQSLQFLNQTFHGIFRCLIFFLHQSCHIRQIDLSILV